MPPDVSGLFDLYRWEHRVVRARNALYFRLHAKGDRDRPRVFVIGHPRTGTKSLHRLLQAGGWRCLHSSGNWPTDRFDCFSDRGNFQPFTRMDETYRNALFILNTRPVYKYIRSVIHHRFGRGRKSKGWFEPSVRNIANEIRERNDDFLRFVRHFRGQDNFLVVNIERPGAFDLVGRRLGLEPVDAGNRPRDQWRPQDLEKIEAALARLGIEQERDEPFVLDALTGEADRRTCAAFLEEGADRILL
ncbi:MAG TPA: hypothetical protein VKA55_07515 [Gammaproteobacteria bacterium]|nr:hypothetical protein [Gammaproteobacteria bacterium]